MGRRGPPKTPTALKRLRGTDQPCRRNQSEPAPRPGVPDAPVFLDAAARTEWHRLLPELEVRGLLEAIDLAVLAVYCTAWSRLVAAERALAVEGDVVVDACGRLKTSPFVRVAATARTQLIAAAREMGLSPASRASVTAAPPPGGASSEERQRRFFGARVPAGGTA